MVQWLRSAGTISLSFRTGRRVRWSCMSMACRWAVLASLNACNGPGDLLMGWDTLAGDYFNGTIDNVRVYNRALASTDVQNLIAAAPPGTLPLAAALSFPATGATQVGINPSVTAMFNEPVQASTISFFLQDPTGKTVPATFTYNAANGTVTLVPESALAYGTTYTASLSFAQNQSGSYLSTPVSWSFTTVPDPVTTPPTVTSATPAGGSTGVANTTFIAATFSEPVLKSTINFVVKDSSGTTVPGSVSYNPSDQTAIFLPSAALSNSTTYTATVSGAQNQLGVAMTSPLSWTFTTGSSTSAIASVGLTQGWATFGEVLPTGQSLHRSTGRKPHDPDRRQELVARRVDPLCDSHRGRARQWDLLDHASLATGGKLHTDAAQCIGDVQYQRDDLHGQFTVHPFDR